MRKSEKDPKKNRMSFGNAWKYNIKGIVYLYRRYPRTITLRIVSVMLEALSPYAVIYLSARIVGELAGGRSPQRLQQLVLITLLVSAGLSLLKGIFSRWSEAENAGLYMKIHQLFSQKRMQLDYVQVDSAQVQSQYTKIIQSMNGAGWGLSRLPNNTQKAGRALFTFAGGIALTLSLFTSRVPTEAGSLTVLNHPLMALLMMLALAGVSVLAPALDTRADAFWVTHANDHIMGNRLFSFYFMHSSQKEMAADVRMYRQDRIGRRYFLDKQGTFGSQGLFAHYSRTWGGLLHAASAAVSVLFTGLIYGFVCLKAWGGAFGVGEVTQYVAAVTALAGGLTELMHQAGDMRNNAAFLKDCFEFLELPCEMYKGSLAVEKRSGSQYEIEFRDVGFRYPGSDSWALRHVSLKLQMGQKLAVVGQNGSGKTTFIKLLCRLYDPVEGEILLNGIPIQEYQDQEYRDIFSIVFQDFKLLSLPLGENVAGRQQYDRARAERCLRRAGFGDRLDQLPAGLDTYLYKDFQEQGVEVSGGEAQKIALARALYKDAPFIILDEPTAALDPIAEYEIYTRFNEMVGGHTTVYISHRLSSCRFCQQIVVFDAGSIVQQGSHEELAADTDGKYYELWNAQAQYYTEKGIELS